MKQLLPWLLGACLVGAPAQAEVLRVCLGDVPHPPWRLGDAQGKPVREGVDYLFLRLLEQRAGVTVSVSLLPSKRCLSELQSGQQDAILSISHLPEREVYGLYPQRDGQIDTTLAMRHHRYAWYVQAGTGLHWDGKQLQGLPPGQLVGVQTGYSIAGLVRDMGYSVDEAVRSIDANLDKLARGRVAAAVLQISEADAVLARRSDLAQTVRRLEPHLQERAYFMVFGRAFAARSKLSMAQWWHAVAAVRDSAEYRQGEAAAWQTMASALSP